MWTELAPIRYGVIESPGFLDTWCHPVMVNFLSLQKVSDNYFVAIANGSYVPIIGVGEINFYGNLNNYEIFYIPSFRINLLSLSKIYQSLNCNVIFFLLIQLLFRRTMGKKITKAKFSNEL